VNATTKRRRPAPRRARTDHPVVRPTARVMPRVPTDPRFSRRRRAVEREQRRRLLVRASAAGIVAVVVWVAFFSPLLRVDEVKVVGARRTPADDVVAAAALGSGQNLLLLSTSEVAERVRGLPWVRSVDVDRMLPGKVRIRVSERRPAMILSLGAARWMVDATGRVLQSGATGRNLPVLAGVQVVTVEPGVRLRTKEAQAALAVWRRLPRSIRRDVVGIVAPTMERITLSLADGTLVRYGAPEEIPAKNEILTVLLKRVRAEDTEAAYIDVRAPLHPAISARDPEADPAEGEGNEAREGAEESVEPDAGP
jgi:cell division protein FtsQ